MLFFPPAHSLAGWDAWVCWSNLIILNPAIHLKAFQTNTNPLLFLTFSIFSSSILKNSCWLSEEWMLLRAEEAAQQVRDEGKKTLLCSFGTAETYSIFPLEPASSEGGSWPRRALFSCRIKSTFHFLITEKPTKTCSECSIKDARETHCAVRAVHSSLIGAEVLDFLHSFHPVLICDRGRGAHLLMHGEQRTSLSGQPSRPHSSEQGWC